MKTRKSVANKKLKVTHSKMDNQNKIREYVNYYSMMWSNKKNIEEKVTDGIREYFRFIHNLMCDIEIKDANCKEVMYRKLYHLVNFFHYNMYLASGNLELFKQVTLKIVYNLKVIKNIVMCVPVSFEPITKFNEFISVIREYMGIQYFNIEKKDYLFLQYIFDSLVFVYKAHKVSDEETKTKNIEEYNIFLKKAVYHMNNMNVSYDTKLIIVKNLFTLTRKVIIEDCVSSIEFKSPENPLQVMDDLQTCFTEDDFVNVIENYFY